MTSSGTVEVGVIEALQRAGDAGDDVRIADPALPAEPRDEPLGGRDIDVPVDVRDHRRVGRAEQVVRARRRIIQRADDIARLGDRSRPSRSARG